MLFDDVWRRWKATWVAMKSEDQYEYQYIEPLHTISDSSLSYLANSELSDVSSTKRLERPQSMTMVRGNLRGSALRGAIASVCGVAFLVSGPCPVSCMHD